MSPVKLSNISVREYRSFLAKAGCKYLRTSDGHEIWSRADLDRPVIFQTHISPVPEFIIGNGLKTLGIDRKEFFEILNK